VPRLTMADAASGDRTWSAANLLQTFSEAAAAVHPLPGNLGKLVDELQSALTSPTKLELLQPSEQPGAAFAAIERPPEVAAQAKEPRPTSSQPHAVSAKQSTSTLAVLSAAAASLKDKTHQVAQQQKRALSTFQQKGGLVGWLHGEMEESDEHATPDTPASPSPAPATPPTSPSSVQLETSCRYDLLTPPVNPPTAKRLAVEKPVGRRQSMPNMGSTSLLDSFFDKVAGVAVSSAAQPPPGTSPRVKLRPSVAAIKSSPSSFDDFESRKQGAQSAHPLKSPSTAVAGRHRAATTDVPTHHLEAGPDISTPPALLKARSAASLHTPRPPSDTRFSLDDVLSDEWSSTVLWAHLCSSAAGRDQQHHQRLSFLIEATFHITPLYRNLAGGGGTCPDKQSECSKLIKRLNRLHSRFLSHHGAATLATSGVPVASPAASHAKNQLSLAVHSLAALESPSNADEHVEKALSSLLQLAREVEREFRVLGTRSFTTFADSTLYRDFVVYRSRPGDIAALLRAARIPFYQQPNDAGDSAGLDALAEQSEAATVFVRARCRAFVVEAQPDGSIKFTDISPSQSGDAGTESTAEQTATQRTIDPFLNPAASVHPAASKPLAFNFSAGSGENTFYGAVMWLAVDQSRRSGAEERPSGLCIVSKFPLAHSMRYFIGCLWERVASYEAGSCATSRVVPEDVASASLEMGKRFLSHRREDRDTLPPIDFRLDDLFDSLSLANVLRLFAFVLLEKKIVLVASSYTILFFVSEALRALLYPLVWSHVYVPVLPLALKDCLQCPTPFLFGLHDSYVRRSDTPRPSNDLVVVNLDRDSLTGGGDVFLPPVRHSMLREELFRLCKPHLASRDTVDSFDAENRASFPARAIRRVFHKHLRELLASLEPCVSRFEFADQCVSVVDNSNSSQWPPDAARFCSAMLHTQAVSTYLASTRSDDRQSCIA
jgi:hypothetical protein